ncbi:MAG: hypothetical protein CFH44_01101 [Proteobacteria bacterium]|nr:MAG: hypothetical protein CFH44_01101 [Pseudomonadota bacterium]|tara:strand:+ start:299 stop:685 length:387 start_codon:yes stop_codon:yes gene_type:complete
MKLLKTPFMICLLLSLLSLLTLSNPQMHWFIVIYTFIILYAGYRYYRVIKLGQFKNELCLGLVLFWVGLISEYASSKFTTSGMLDLGESGSVYITVSRIIAFVLYGAAIYVLAEIPDKTEDEYLNSIL